MFGFSEQERAVFAYSNGEKEVHADPLALRRKLIQASGGTFISLLAQCQEDDKPPDPANPASLQIEIARQDAQEKVLACTRQAFGLPAVDEGTGKGVTEAMCWSVLWKWWDFMEGNASGGESQPSLPSTSDSLPEPS